MISRRAKGGKPESVNFFKKNSGGVNFLVFHWPKNFEDIV